MKSELVNDDLLSRWKNRDKKEPVALEIPKAPEGAVIPLSNGQQGLWFLQDLNKGNSFYNYGETYDITGDWSIPVLKESLRIIYNTHDILRSNYVLGTQGLELRIKKDSPLRIAEFDFDSRTPQQAIDEAKKVISKDFKTPFDLSDSPLLRVAIIKISKDRHILSVTMHHIITDEWSMDIFIRMLAENYRRLSTDQPLSEKEAKINFSDFAYWDHGRQWPQKELDFWKGTLSDTKPPLSIQADFKRPALPSYRGDYRTVGFPKKLSTDLLNLATELEVTPFVLLLSVFYVLLFRHTGQKDIAIGSPIAKRNHKGLEDLLGFFLDTLVLRNEIQENSTFLEVVSKVKTSTLEAFAHKDIPFDMLVKEINPERSAGMNPFFQVMFVYNTEFRTPDFGAGLVFEKTDLVSLESSKFDITLFISQKEGELTASLEYATDLFDVSTIDRLLAHLQLLAEGVVKDRKALVSKLPMQTPEELNLFSEMAEDDSPEVTDRGGIHKLIEQYALETPDAPAISFGNNTMTYSQLDAQVTVIAQQLLGYTHGENVLIGLCIDRSLEMLVGLLAILKAGAAYVPLDPEYPEERIRYILEDSKASLVLTTDDHLGNFKSLEVRCVSMTLGNMPEPSGKFSLPQVNGDDLAYVIYTSGSTGKPKGVPISHQNIISSTEARFDYYDRNPEAFLLLSSISFDSSKAGIFWTLCSGGNLVITEKRLEQDMVALANCIGKYGISHLLTLPTLYGLMLDHIDPQTLEQLNTVIVAGEVCPLSLPERHFDLLGNGVDLYNEYGPTEATVWCTAHHIKPDSPYKSIAIGQAIAGTTIHILNTALEHVPYGAVGELYISGKGLSKGYLGKPELTKERFVENPFRVDGKNQLMYRSGDLGRLRPDGTIEFLGRVDSQVKLRGFRIELEEIEESLLAHPQVKEAAVLIKTPHREMNNAQGILVAYLTLGSPMETEGIKGYLKRSLPKHMVPSQFICLDELVKLPNGKVDKKHLERLEFKVSAAKDVALASRTPTENTLMEIWEKILGFKGLGIDDNFFDVGGDSIRTIQVISEARKLGLVISPNQLFDFQTVRELASFVDQNQEQEDQWDYLAPLRKEGSRRPLFCIHAGGGHVFFYNKLTEYLADEIPIYALQPSGVYGDKSMHTSVNGMTRAYLEAIRTVQPQGPYNILVYCFSASVGNEMALLLEESGEKINLIVMDTMTAPAVLNTPRRLRIRIQTFLMRFMRAPFRSLRNMVLSKYALVRLRWRSNFEEDEESRELERLRVNLMDLSQTYQWRPFKGQVSLILTKKDHEALNRETIRSWKALAETELNIVRTQGSHRELFDEPYVKHTAKAIEKCMFED